MQKMDHENLIRGYEHFEDAKNIYFVMDLVCACVCVCVCVCDGPGLCVSMCIRVCVYACVYECIFHRPLSIYPPSTPPHVQCQGGELFDRIKAKDPAYR
jgi:hypothetical protein